MLFAVFVSSHLCFWSGIFKQVAWAAGCTAVGGIVGGPVGAMAGGLVGTDKLIESFIDF